MELASEGCQESTVCKSCVRSVDNAIEESDEEEDGARGQRKAQEATK